MMSLKMHLYDLKLEVTLGIRKPTNFLMQVYTPKIIKL